MDGSRPPDRVRARSATFATMGTIGRVTWAPKEAEIASQLIIRVSELEARMSRFRDDSDIMGLSDQWKEVSPDTLAVLLAGQRYTRETGGYFGILVGSRMREWHAASEGSGPVPQPEEIRGLLEFSGSRCRIVDGPARSVDLGAIAKGYASDELRDLALDLGATDVLVSLGGSSISVAGAPAQIALSSPWTGRDGLGTLTLFSGSLSVSADPGTPIGRRRQRSHVLDPRTGMPALTDLCGVVVCGADGMACEAYSTAYLAMGLDAALELDVQHPELDTIFMTIDGRMLASPNLTITAEPGLQQWLKDQRNRTESRHVHPSA